MVEFGSTFLWQFNSMHRIIFDRLLMSCKQESNTEIIEANESF